MVRTDNLLNDRPRPIEERFGLRVITACLCHNGQVVQRLGHLAVIRVQQLLTYLQCALMKLFRHVDTALIVVDPAQAIQRFGHIRMLGAEGLLADLECPLVARLCLAVAALVLINTAQFDQRAGHARVVGFEKPLVSLQRLLQQQLGLVILSIVAKDDADGAPQFRLGLRIVLETARVDVPDGVLHGCQNCHVVARRLCSPAGACAEGVSGLQRGGHEFPDDFRPLSRLGLIFLGGFRGLCRGHSLLLIFLCQLTLLIGDAGRPHPARAPPRPRLQRRPGRDAGAQTS